MANFNSTWGGYNADADINSVCFEVNDPAADLDITIFRFPVAGRLRGVYFTPKATLAAGTTDHYEVSLFNGGTSGTATTVATGTVGGTVGWTAQTTKTATISAANFAAGEYVVINYDETGTVAPEFVVQVDYSLNPTS